MADWDINNAAGLFSPSAAHQQQIQDEEWRFVLDWLAPLYHPKPIPPFERNADTLAALLALANASEAADEEKKLRLQVERDALAYYKQEDERRSRQDASRGGGGARGEGKEVDIGQALMKHLTPEAHDALEAMAKTAVIVGTSDVSSTTSIAKSMIQVQQLSMQVDHHLLHAQQLLANISQTLSALRSARDKYQDDSFKANPEQPAQISEWTRTAKMLQQKAVEYKDRTAAMEQARRKKMAGQVSIEELIKMQEEIRILKDEVEELEAQVMGFKGLPSKKELAELEVEALRRELRALENRREEMYEKVMKIT